MKQRKDITVPVEAELVEEIENQLTYGDSRPEWIRKTIQMRLDSRRKVEVKGKEPYERIKLHVLSSSESVQDLMEDVIVEWLNQDT